MNTANAQPKLHLTPQEYLAWERHQEIRHEYVNDEIYAMSGASRRHNVVCINIIASLHSQMRGRLCEVYSNDMRVKVNETGMYTYPDIVAVCGEPQFEDIELDTLLNPVIIIEVLSESTERYDRGAKFAHYRSLPSLRDYLFVAQTEYHIEHYARQTGDRWLFTEYKNLDATVTLDSINCNLLLRDVYERVGLLETIE